MKLLVAGILVVVAAIISRQIYVRLEAKTPDRTDVDEAVLPVSYDAHAECQRFHDQLPGRAAASDTQPKMTIRTECVES
ncbi:hypothetical protein CupriaWKF_07175 [Cupriavidus sp. WKF15]|uniref:hypothetical protein n=1 Tax=Cupriavidus sp. WKF15 TaxID=3032282 RepID=UPI0023E0CF9C|nr:hypothetical protein [Cupriavidus sp. WKF15]WER47322.1 hypothetical protein CupriaWKF_07175 [Cupriavidus sp. WKF15]